MKHSKILLSAFMLLLFTACGGSKDGSGGSSSTSPSIGGNLGGGNAGGSGGNTGGGGTPQTCSPIATTALKSYTANSAILSFANAGPVFTIVNSEISYPTSSISVLGKLDYWNADTNIIARNIWSHPATGYIYSAFEDLSYCFGNMNAGIATNQIVCAIEASHLAGGDRFLMFRINPDALISPPPTLIRSTPTATLLGGISNMGAFFIPMNRFNSTELLGANYDALNNTVITDVNVNTPLDTAEHYWVLAQNQYTIPNTMRIGSINYDRARRFTANNWMPSIPFAWNSKRAVLTLYKNPTTNSYRLILVDDIATNHLMASLEFSPTVAVDRLMWDGETQKIYLLGRDLKEVFVFDLSNGIALQKHFLVSPTDTQSFRLTDKAVSIGKFIFTFGRLYQGSTGKNVVVAIDTQKETEKAIFESGYFESNAGIGDRNYDIKAYSMGNEKGIVLKKDRELKLYSADESLCP